MKGTMKDLTKQHFEQNMLDGDSVEDCGGAMLSAESVWEYLEQSISKAEGGAKGKVIGEVIVFIKKYMDEHDKADSSFSTDNLIGHLMKELI